jgi:osmotically-inducible protein OsmY
VPRGAIRVDVADGWVTLSGEVRRHIQRRAAEHVVEKLAGVRGVTNNLVLSSEPIPGDVAERINHALARNALIDDTRIKVSSSDRTVYLDGTPDSWVADQAAVGAAWSAPGVNAVVDRLTIAP